MKISGSAYMAVESMARLATYSADAPCTTQGLAEWISRSAPYTETLMGRLRAAGLVKAVRGPGGGYYLSRPADRISAMRSPALSGSDPIWIMASWRSTTTPPREACGL